MEGFFVIMSMIIGFVIVTRPITVLLHELGHAVTAILLTRNTVSVYVGSYGDPNGCFHFSLGSHELWLKHNPLKWQFGVCIPKAKEVSVEEQIVFTLAGPLTSFVIAFAACSMALMLDFHAFLKLFLIVFFGSAVLDLILNIIPNKSPIKLYDGRETFNDGYQLKKLFHRKKMASEYERAALLYEQNEYENAALCFESIITNGVVDEIAHRGAISANCLAHKWEEAAKLVDDFLDYDQLQADDYALVGIVYSFTNRPEESLKYYEKSILLNPNNKEAVSNTAFTFIILNRFDEAVPLFDKAIELDSTDAYAYSNRGLAKIKMGMSDDGLRDIMHSLELNEGYSYGLRNLGVYHLDKGEYSKALELFKKAKEQDSTTYQIDELIESAMKYLEE